MLGVVVLDVGAVGSGVSWVLEGDTVVGVRQLFLVIFLKFELLVEMARGGGLVRLELRVVLGPDHHFLVERKVVSGRELTVPEFVYVRVMG